MQKLKNKLPLLSIYIKLILLYIRFFYHIFVSELLHLAVLFYFLVFRTDPFLDEFLFSSYTLCDYSELFLFREEDIGRFASSILSLYVSFCRKSRSISKVISRIKTNLSIAREFKSL